MFAPPKPPTSVAGPSTATATQSTGARTANAAAASRLTTSTSSLLSAFRRWSVSSTSEPRTASSITPNAAPK